MKLVVGLGNPGLKYKNTRHNIGFMILDKLAENNVAAINKKKFNSKYCELLIRGEKMVLIKPMTYMNKSGDSLIQWKNFYKVHANDILVIYDDMDMELGNLKIKPKGGYAGHKGLGSIVESTGTKEIPRMKIGIGKPDHPKMNPADYVLQKFNKEEVEKIKPVIDRAADAAEEFSYKSLDDIMTKYNTP